MLPGLLESIYVSELLVVDLMLWDFLAIRQDRLQGPRCPKALNYRLATIFALGKVDLAYISPPAGMLARWLTCLSIVHGHHGRVAAAVVST